ncbi:MAG: glycosyltransferase family 2 protein [Flectobacillus sp.]|nr:glycosyltransferase family 2 protein [Flectobacillus sp.]
MALNEQPLLTIAIPTYNRSFYLERNLENVLMQYSREMSIEILISDNASTDDTKDIVEKFIYLGLPIRYLKNSINEGADYNIGQCYWSAQSKFVLVLGDDDILLSGAIKKILYIIENVKDELGVIHLKAHGFKDDYLKEKPKDNLVKGFISYDNKEEYIEQISHYVTFISVNVVNTKFVDDKQVALEYKDTKLIQVSSILKAILSAPHNIYVTECLMMGQMDNSGGYDLFNVFAKNLYGIYQKVGGDRFARIIMREVIKESIPFYIMRFRENNIGSYSVTIDKKYLDSLKKDYTSYWGFIYPLLALPKSVIFPYFVGIRALNKLRRSLRILYKIGQVQPF